MQSLNPYLNFPGTCRDALELYKKCFNGEISAVQTYGDAHMEGAGDTKDKILHSEFKAEGIHFMASDDMRGFQVHSGNNVSLTLDVSDPKEQERIFNTLADGGTISMPLAKTFWGAMFGMLTDRYGIQWLVNCNMQ